jgi:hypothetical protein
MLSEANESGRRGDAIVLDRSKRARGQREAIVRFAKDFESAVYKPDSGVRSQCLSKCNHCPVIGKDWLPITTVGK